MKKIVLFLLTIVSFSASFSQNPDKSIFEPIDTFFTDKGTVIIYPDRTWEYIEDRGFDGILNYNLHEIIVNDSNYMYKSYWKNNVTITCGSNEVKSMKDTLWMCLLDTLHDSYCLPLNGNIRVTSTFGPRKGRNHNGIDLDLETGDTVYAVFDGKIRYSQLHPGGFGNLVIIRHYNGLETYYAHLSKLLVAPNQDIKAGDPIALGGNTGRSTGSHLHFEVRFYDQPINPEHIFDFHQKDIKDENLLVHAGIFSNARVYSSSSSPSASSSSSSSSPSTYSKNGKKYYKVRSGDTLGAIARRNNTTVSKLCQLNNMKETDVLQIGQTIRVQ